MSTGSRRRYGAHSTKGGVTFALWAPTDKSVELAVEGRRLPLIDKGDGWREERVQGLHAGARYAFVIDGSTQVPDPASAFQPEGVFAPSQVVDHQTFHWTDGAWRGRPWSEAVIWEAHVGTATPEGTYRALIDKLPHLAATGVTAIELMPLAEVPGERNWGYDGVLPFAPHAAYGTPDDLKALVDAAHRAGIMMLLDVVYNHFGPAGNFLHLYAERFFTQRHKTPWGAAINFDCAGSEFVRAFFIDNALQWLRDYHMDGLRFDAAHAMLDDSDTHFLHSMASAIHAEIADRPVHLILENEHNQSKWLERDERDMPRDFTAQWNDDFHHCWHVLLTGESEGYYGHFADRPIPQLERSLKDGFVFQGEEVSSGRTRGEPSGHLTPLAFVNFLQNHDQVGNRAFGERLTVLADEDRISVARAVLLLSPQVPMLFMGEEWGSRTPFCFFVDFADDPALSKAVRDGRRQEFAAFAAFAEGEGVASIPDPTDRQTFLASKLDWSNLDQEVHARILAETRRLLELRARHVAPLTASKWMGAASRPSHLIDIRWRFAAGILHLRLNMSERASEATIEETEAIIHQSARVTLAGRQAFLPTWSCLFTAEAA
jgi:maltooligosyltrehalose trehalohydrolase